MSDSDYISQDGSPMAMYLALPAGDAPSIIDSAIRPDSSILELGSGPGRLTRVLVALGHQVTAVDDSPRMLAHVTGAETVVDDLYNLDLGRSFDVVLAASHLINRPGRSSRSRLLTVAHRHLEAGGVLLIQRYPPGWLIEAAASHSAAGPVHLTFEPLSAEGSVRSAAMTYRLGSKSWRQDFEAEDVPDAMLRAEASAAGFAAIEHLEQTSAWVKLVKATHQPSDY